MPDGFSMHFIINSLTKTNEQLGKTRPEHLCHIIVSEYFLAKIKAEK